MIAVKRRWSRLPRFAFIGARMRAFLGPDDTSALSCYHISLPPKGSIPPAFHKKAFELIWIMKGGGRARLGRRSLKVKKGDSLLIRPPTPHAFFAGPSGMTFLAILSPRVDSQTDYYSCHGPQAAPRVLSGKLVEGRKALA